ncbi:hypothetical protein BD779DRAFT_308498 [Infundibulicybe gibba]|nr:hypothetical protein BD779DRAFT_308498 [Infundibulicybe gibba]
MCALDSKDSLPEAYPMMISRIIFLALLQAFASSTVSAASVSGAGSEVVTVGEHQIRVATAPIPASLLSSTNVAGRSLPGTSLINTLINNVIQVRVHAQIFSARCQTPLLQRTAPRSKLP